MLHPIITKHEDGTYSWSYGQSGYESIEDAQKWAGLALKNIAYERGYQAGLAHVRNKVKDALKALNLGV